MIQSDVCIIGAGPAGAATSMALAKMKIHHIIVDAEIFPRDKVCGDGLDTTVLRVFNSIEPGFFENEILLNNNFIKSKSILIHFNETKKTVIKTVSNKYFNYPIFCFCKRSYFDNFLISKLDTQYAQFLQGTKVKNISHEDSRKIIYANQDGKEIKIKAKVVVGADGDHSAVLRSLGVRKIDRNHYAGALRLYWKGIRDIQTDVFEVYFPKLLPLCYLWIFPLPNGEANVGLGMQSALIAKNNIDLKKVMADLIDNDPVINARFKDAFPIESMKGYGLPLASLQRKVYGDGWLLTGDAASLVCPITGEGIGPAMLSGYIAAHFIQRAILQNDFSADIFRHYDREVYKRLKGNIQVYQLLQKLSPKLYSFILKCIMSFPFVKKRTIKYFNRKIELACTEKIPVCFD